MLALLIAKCNWFVLEVWQETVPTLLSRLKRRRLIFAVFCCPPFIFFCRLSTCWMCKQSVKKDEASLSIPVQILRPLSNIPPMSIYISALSLDKELPPLTSIRYVIEGKKVLELRGRQLGVARWAASQAAELRCLAQCGVSRGGRSMWGNGSTA